MVCKKCGFQNTRGALYCSGCGKRLVPKKINYILIVGVIAISIASIMFTLLSTSAEVEDEAERNAVQVSVIPGSYSPADETTVPAEKHPEISKNSGVDAQRNERNEEDTYTSGQADKKDNLSTLPVWFMSTLKNYLLLEDKKFEQTQVTAPAGMDEGYLLSSENHGSFEILMTLDDIFVKTITVKCGIEGLTESEIADRVDTLVLAYCVANPNMTDDDLTIMIDPNKVIMDGNGGYIATNSFNGVAFSLMVTQSDLCMLITAR